MGCAAFAAGPPGSRTASRSLSSQRAIRGRQRLKPATQGRQPDQKLVVSGRGRVGSSRPLNQSGSEETSGKRGTSRPCKRERSCPRPSAVDAPSYQLSRTAPSRSAEACASIARAPHAAPCIRGEPSRCSRTRCVWTAGRREATFRPCRPSPGGSHRESAPSDRPVRPHPRDRPIRAVHPVHAGPPQADGWASSSDSGHLKQLASGGATSSSRSGRPRIWPAAIRWRMAAASINCAADAVCRKGPVEAERGAS